eukprot:Gb_30420 [translate_table: standard]
MNVVPPLISPPPIAQISLFLWCHDVVGTDPSIDSAFAIVPPPSLQKLAMRVEELELEMVFQAHCTCEESEALNLMKEVGELGFLPPAEHASMVSEIPLHICPHVHLLRQMVLKAKEAPLIPLEIRAKLSQLEFEAASLQEQINDLKGEAEQKEQELTEYVAEIQQLMVIPAQLIAGVQQQLTSAREEVGDHQRRLAISLDVVAEEKEARLTRLSQLAKMSYQLLSKRALLENEYHELQGRESCLGENDKSGYWRERARVLAGRTNAILEDTLPMTSSTQGAPHLTPGVGPLWSPCNVEVYDLQEVVMRENLDLRGKVPSSNREQVPGVIIETEAHEIVGQEETLVAPARTEGVLEHAIEQTKTQSPRSSGQELETRKRSKVPTSQNSPSREVPHDSPVPTRDLDDLVHDISSTFSLDVPPGFSIPLALP